MKQTVSVFWFRRDLRLEDNAGLYYALRSGNPVLPVFVFDTLILDKLEQKTDRRVEFILQLLDGMQKKLKKSGGGLRIFHGTPEHSFKQLLSEFDVKAVYTNEDYESYARERDAEIETMLKDAGALFHLFKDQLIFSKNEVLKDNGTPYTVFTPYNNKWMAALKPFFLQSYPVEKYYPHFLKHSSANSPTLEELGFKAADEPFPPPDPGEDLIRHYAKQRDFPGLDATTRVGLHLRFGSISIRRLMREAKNLSAVYMKELVWREFYAMILWHFPQVGRGHAFKKEYEHIKWRNNEKEFTAWCEGRTGYPIVDAGMRQLNQTGFMHNRVRMITASFLIKHLLIDWRWGEAYFAEKLLDYDFANNNGGWQWAASTGCDAAPYFRVFNPTLQQTRFDPKGDYIRKWVPEIAEMNYPEPIVDHVFARNRALETYKKALAAAGR